MQPTQPDIVLFPSAQVDRFWRADQKHLRVGRSSTNKHGSGAELKHPDQEINSIEEFLASLRETALENLVWFRGQARSEWKLIPNIARETDAHPGGAMDLEAAAIKRFKQNAGAFLSKNPEGTWQWIFLMQHHRALTRLLDWSESPLVALYFALEQGHDEFDAAVWCLDPMRLNEHAGHRSRNPRDVLGFEDDNQLDSYLPEMVTQGQPVLGPVAAIAPRNTARMAAQSATFTIIHADPKPIEDVNDGSHIWRFMVPAQSKQALREDMRLMGFNELMLFPGLERVAAHALELLQ